MHELSIALEICRVIEERLAPGQLPQLVELGLDIGDDTTIEVANLQFCLDTLMANPPFAGATVVIARAAKGVTRA